MHKPIRLLVLITTLLPLLAWACFTSERARILNEQHPDLDFEDLAHQMHRQSQIEYDFSGAADCVDGTADGFSCSKVRLAGWLPLEDIGGGANGADNWGWVHEQSGRMFALMGRSNGVAFVEITDPEQPLFLGNLPRPSGVSDSVWTDIKTYDNHAFIVADAVTGQGIQIFDLRRLLQVDPDQPETFDTDAHFAGFDSAHNIAINEQTGYAYAVGGEQCAGGLLIVDIRQPQNPQQAGCYADDGYTHDVQCVIYSGPDPDYQGREICLASNEDSLTVVDVTYKSRPQTIARHGYDHSYSHQGWFTEDQRYFLLDDELDERNQSLKGTRTLIFDLQDLDSAPAPAEHIADGLSIDHNQYVIGDYVFQANYQRGLRILKIDDASAGRLSEVAWFDTFPGPDDLSFEGAWSVFPYFGNNIVMVSDINRGLFILEVTDPTIAKALQDAMFDDRFEPQ
ncbi:MAG: choice-of-anchor B family protein [Xanthomonadales bacterium]|nr:choice-of-anchor B family protein [Xanthomonadales bacterium]